VHFSERSKFFLALELLAGAVIFPLGVLLQTFSHGPVSRAVAIAGSGFLIAALAAVAFGVGRSSTAAQ
jgi:hypothetical protein